MEKSANGTEPTNRDEVSSTLPTKELENYLSTLLFHKPNPRISFNFLHKLFHLRMLKSLEKTCY